MNPIFADVLEIDPRQLLGGISSLELTCSADQWAGFDQSLKLTDDLKVKLGISALGSGKYLLSVHYVCKRIMTCSRTLQEFVYTQEGDFQIMAIAIAGSAECVLDDSDEELYELRFGVAADSFSIAECLRQEILLNEPTRPLAVPDTEFHWESQENSTTEQSLDPRWAKLKSWSTKKPTSTGD